MAALVSSVFISAMWQLAEIEAEDQAVRRTERELRWRAALIKAIEEEKAFRASLPEINPDCKKCRHYHGVVYYSDRLVCAMHPRGMENCPDWESHVIE